MELAEAESVSRGVGSIRVDTHPDNRVMKSLIASLGYTYCGTVEYESPRLAYEKVVGGNWENHAQKRRHRYTYIIYGELFCAVQNAQC